MTCVSRIVCTVAALAFGSAAYAEIDILPVTFSCDGGVQLPVTYFNSADGSGAAAMVVDGNLVALRQAPSGSGIRYESVGGVGTYVLRSKGWNATVGYLAAEGAASEQPVLTGCTSR